MHLPGWQKQMYRVYLSIHIQLKKGKTQNHEHSLPSKVSMILIIHFHTVKNTAISVIFLIHSLARWTQICHPQFICLNTDNIIGKFKNASSFACSTFLKATNNIKLVLRTNYKILKSAPSEVDFKSCESFPQNYTLLYRLIDLNTSLQQSGGVFRCLIALT